MSKAVASSDKKTEFFLASESKHGGHSTEMIPVHLTPAVLLSLEDVTFGGMVASALSFGPGFY